MILQEIGGADAVFSYSSSNPQLNVSIPTSGGHGQSTAAALAAGSYTVTADDMSGAGLGLAGLFCSDNDSTTDIVSRTATIVLDAGEALICTFTSINATTAHTPEKTTQLIENFLTTRAGQILSTGPTSAAGLPVSMVS